MSTVDCYQAGEFIWRPFNTGTFYVLLSVREINEGFMETQSILAKVKPFAHFDERR